MAWWTSFSRKLIHWSRSLEIKRSVFFFGSSGNIFSSWKASYHLEIESLNQCRVWGNWYRANRMPLFIDHDGERFEHGKKWAYSLIIFLCINGEINTPFFDFYLLLLCNYKKQTCTENGDPLFNLNVYWVSSSLQTS